MPSSGEISFANFRSEFNDSGEIRMSDFYRGGPFVDATNTTTTTFIDAGPWSSYQGPSGLSSGGTGITPPPSTAWYAATSRSTGMVAFRRIYWNGVFIGSPGAFYRYQPGDGYEYQQGSLDSNSTYVDSQYEYRYSSVRRRTYSETTTTTTSNVNTQVPTSGTIGMLNMRGARDY